MKLKFNLSLQDDKAILHNKKEFISYLQASNRKSFTLTIEPKRNTRSSLQNRYLWGVLYPIATKSLSEIWGERVSIDETHLFLRMKFWYSERVDVETGEITNFPKSTTEMTTTDMMAYQEDCRSWLSKYLNVVVPEPGEQAEIEF
jgi:hypothetical protein